MKTFIFALLAIFSAQALTHNYKYSDLVIRDYDEMNKEVQVRIRNAQKKGSGDGDATNHEAVEELRDALKLVYSRPNSDNMVGKLTPDVRRELNNMSSYEDALSSIV